MACVKAAQIQCLYKITIAKITCVIWKFTSPVIERLLRLPDYIQYKMSFMEKVIL